jgi:exodeoxyribonuclease VII large subunit
MIDVFSVADLMRRIRGQLAADNVLQDMWVGGEVSNMTRARSGHWYFTLKDGEAAMKCVMWRSDAVRQRFVPEEGTRLAAHGRVDVYPARGDVQFYADFLRPTGVGDLYVAFEQLKGALAVEGLFDAANKRAIPAFPRRIGVVTSADAAAFRDVQHVLGRRFPLAEVVLSPSLVQGATAPAALVAALSRLDVVGVDVILIVRGGGSIEDLWAFNDEGLARAVFAARTPIISGVGHETDFTIVDFVADERAPTPSAAAEIATPDLNALREDVLSTRARLGSAMAGYLGEAQAQLESATRELAYRSPVGRVATYRQQVDERRAALERAGERNLARLRERLAAKTAALHAASPQAILERGYAIVTDAEGKVVRGAGGGRPGDKLMVRLADGEIAVTVDDES